ncbi:hypothetical protein BH10CYA1_BH10CYA1_24620 [soil metagenome]
MHKRRIHWLFMLPLLLPLPALAQGTMEFGSVHAAAVGLGAGLAASRSHGQVIRKSYEAMVQAEQATLVQTKAIKQYMTLGCELESKKRWSDAEKSFTYVLKVVALRDGPGSIKSVPALKHLVTVSQQQGKLAEAIDFQKTVVAFSKSAKVPDPQAVLGSQVDLTNLFLLKNDYTSAEPILREAVTSNSAAIPREKRRAAMSTYAKVLRKLHRDAEADVLEAADETSSSAPIPATTPLASNGEPTTSTTGAAPVGADRQSDTTLQTPIATPQPLKASTPAPIVPEMEQK